MTNTFDEILTQFANRNTAGYVVWGQKLMVAHNRECEMLNAEIDAMTKFNDELNKQVKVLTAENARLRAALESVMTECQYRTCRRTCGFLDKDDRTYDCSLKNCPFAEERK